MSSKPSRRKEQAPVTAQRPPSEIEELRSRLAEAEETLRAIRDGEVDAIVVAGAGGDRVYSLTSTESVYRLVVETMAEAALTATPEGTILFCNRRFADFVKTPMEQILGRTLSGFVAPEERDGLDALLARSRTESVKRRIVFRAHDDTPIPAHVSANLLRDTGGDSICIVATDLTELETSTQFLDQLREQQDALRRSEERYRSLFNGMTEGFAVHEIITTEQGTPVDYRFLDVNPAFERLTGLKREDLVGRTHNEILHGDDPKWIREYGQVALTGRPVHFENYSPALKRHYEVVAYRPAPMQFAVIFMDVTERKQSEEELRQLNRTLKAHGDSSQAMMRAENEMDYLQEVCRIVVEDCGHAMVWVGYAEDDAGKSVRPVAQAGFEEGYLKTVNISWADTERGRGPTGTAIRTGRPSSCRDMLTDPEFELWRPEALHRGYASSLVLPLTSDGKTFGAITIYSKYPNPFSEREVHLLSELADDLAHGITSLRLRAEHVKAEQDRELLLAEVERRAAELEATISSTATGLIAYDAVGKAVRMNDAAKEMLPPEIFFNTTVEERARKIRWEKENGQPFPVEEIPVARALRGETTHNVVLAAAFPDHRLWISASAAPIRTLDGRMLGVVASFIDITERKQVEEALRESKERFKVIASSTPDHILVQDRELRYTFVVNPQLGLTEEEMIGKTDFDFLNQDDAENLTIIKQSVLATGTPVHLEVPLATPGGEPQFFSGSYVPKYDAGGRIDGLIGYFTNVTERKRSEDALTASEERFRAIADNAPDMIVRLDRDLRLLYANPAVVRRTGRPIEALAGRTAGEYGASVAASAVWERAARDVLDLGEPRRFDHTNDWQGERRTFDVRMVPERAADGAVRAVIAVARDITDRKKVEAQIRDLNATLARRVAERTALLEQRADQLQRLAIELTNAEDRERERIAGVLHDDLQQHLTALKLRISAHVRAQKDPQSRDRLSELTRLVDESIRKTRALSHDLAPPVPRSSGIRAAIECLTDDLKEKFGLEITVHGDAQARMRTSVHTSAIMRALRELLFNVHKHSGVRAAQVYISGADDEVQVSVCDDGVGFDPAKLRGGEGTSPGLGLFAIRERITLMGGRVDIDSAAGTGCRVSLIMPGGEPVAGAPSPELPARDRLESMESESGRAIRVLLADDHEVLREGLASLLEDAGLQIVGQAANGEEALELAAQLAPDVILMDVSMPKMDGIEATRLIMARFPEMRIIGLSMHADAATGARMLHAGARCYLVKTGPISELIDAIRGR